MAQHVLSNDVIQIRKVLKGFEMLDLIAKVRTVNLQPGKDRFSIMDGQASRVSQALRAQHIVEEKIKRMFFHAKEPVLQILPQVETVEPRRPRVRIGFDASEWPTEDVKFILEKWPPLLHIQGQMPTHETETLATIDIRKATALRTNHGRSKV